MSPAPCRLKPSDMQNMHADDVKNPCVFHVAAAYCCGAVTPCVIAALLGRFLPRLGPLANASGPFFVGVCWGPCARVGLAAPPGIIDVYPSIFRTVTGVHTDFCTVPPAENQRMAPMPFMILGLLLQRIADGRKTGVQAGAQAVDRGDDHQGNRRRRSGRIQSRLRPTRRTKILRGSFSYGPLLRLRGAIPQPETEAKSLKAGRRCRPPIPPRPGTGQAH
jgi:hypothetical protein